MPARAWTVVGLLVGVVGMVGQLLAGVSMPDVPPLAVVMMLTAALLAGTRWKWVPIASVIVAVGPLADLAAQESLFRFADLDAAGWSWVRLVAAIATIATGIVATNAAYQRTDS